MTRWIAAGLLMLVSVPVSAELRAQIIASGFQQPIAVVQDPTDRHVLFVVQQAGRIRPVVNGVIVADFLDLTPVVGSGGERGLLGLAFAPDYATSRRFFVNFTNLSGHTVIARFLRSATNPLAADPASRFDLLWPDNQRFISQPFENHNGGHLAFGPDGYLYIGMGDGGSGGDPGHRAQNPQSLLGKMLRLDVNVPPGDFEGYDIPPGNPFAGTGGVLSEIWAFGFRNPWRWSFDDPGRGGTGALVIGDVGQDAWEEIDYEPAGRSGRNYGWRNREGAHNFLTSLPAFSLPLTDPVFEYSHLVGSSITGGFVYRGAALGPAFTGRYFFADFIKSRVWSLALTIDPLTGEATAGDLVEHTASLGAAAKNVSSFGVDAGGEIYIVSYTGTIFRLINELVSNGSFTNGLDGWLTWGAPSTDDFVGDVSSGVMQFYRKPPPSGAANQAVVFQPTGTAIPSSTPLTARVDLGNTSTARKRVAVLVHDLSFDDLFVCSFWLAPGAPMRTYEIRTHTTKAWSDATISVYAATEGQDGGFYQLDNVTLLIDPESQADGTRCVDPTVPPAPGGPDGQELIGNGSFGLGLSPWGLFGQIDWRINGGVFEFVRPPGEPSGVVLQVTDGAFAEKAILTASFDLGNSSPVRKRVTVLLHDFDFTDLAACTFWIPPGQQPVTYTMRTFATRAWTRASLSVYGATVGLEPWIRLDNVSFRETPSQTIVGTECLEPVSPISSQRIQTPSIAVHDSVTRRWALLIGSNRRLIDHGRLSPFLSEHHAVRHDARPLGLFRLGLVVR